MTVEATQEERQMAPKAGDNSVAATNYRFFSGNLSIKKKKGTWGPSYRVD